MLQKPEKRGDFYSLSSVVINFGVVALMIVDLGYIYNLKEYDSILKQPYQFLIIPICIVIAIASFVGLVRDYGQRRV